MSQSCGARELRRAQATMVLLGQQSGPAAMPRCCEVVAWTARQPAGWITVPTIRAGATTAVNVTREERPTVRWIVRRPHVHFHRPVNSGPSLGGASVFVDQAVGLVSDQCRRDAVRRVLRIHGRDTGVWALMHHRLGRDSESGYAGIAIRARARAALFGNYGAWLMKGCPDVGASVALVPPQIGSSKSPSPIRVRGRRPSSWHRVRRLGPRCPKRDAFRVEEKL